MDDLYKDAQSSLPLDMSSPQKPASGSERGGAGKPEDVGAQLITAEAWNINASGLIKKAVSPVMVVPGPPMISPNSESPGGVALKVAATGLQPICFGDSPVVLPIHLQMAGSAAPLGNQAGNTQYIMTSQGPFAMPLVLEQQVFQRLNSPLLQQGTPCPAISLQNNVLCQNSSLSFNQVPPLDQKSTGQAEEPGILPLFQNPGFTAALQDLFPTQNHPACHPADSTQTDTFSSGLFPPLPPANPYSSPLSPLVPPATLLVPYPIIVPLPVPLPIPIPVPIPVPQSADLKGFTDPPKPACTLNKSTQTKLKEVPSPRQPHGREVTMHPLQFVSTPSPTASEGEVLDLSVRAQPIQTKQEGPFQQDNVLDLSMAHARKPCIHKHVTKELLRREADHSSNSFEKAAGTALSLEVLRPLECTQNLDSKLLNGLASLEFSRQHKWVVDGGNGLSGSESKCRGGNIEIVSTSQTARVIVSVKDAVPAIFCGKITGLSGVSTKNFSIKRDAKREALLQQRYSIKPQVEPGDCSDPLSKTPKNRPIKLKKVNSQEIHILPIKKQRLAAFFPRK